MPKVARKKKEFIDRYEYFLVKRSITDLVDAKVKLNRGDAVYAPISWAIRYGFEGGKNDLLERRGSKRPIINKDKGNKVVDLTIPLQHEMDEDMPNFVGEYEEEEFKSKFEKMETKPKKKKKRKEKVTKLKDYVDEEDLEEEFEEEDEEEEIIKPKKKKKKVVRKRRKRT